MAFKIASSPFTHNQQSTQNIMLWVIAATLPGIVAQCIFFGYGTLIQSGLAIITALVAEAIVMWLRHKNIVEILSDNSALLTGLLLGISLPPLAPWWMIVLGTAFSILIAKQLYGGLGQNPFNPAMIGYVVLLISFPVQMTAWLPPEVLMNKPVDIFSDFSIIFTGLNLDGANLHQVIQGVDGISQATPLDGLKTGLRSGHSMEELLNQPIYQGGWAGIGWQWINLGYLAGGIILLLRKAIHWHIPVSFLLGLFICAAIAHQVSPELYASPIMALFSGATMLGAFFIATDPVTASTTPRGRVIFGTLIGCLVWFIRTYGGYPDGVAFAVLLGNMTVPLIDYYTKPRVYGHR